MKTSAQGELAIQTLAMPMNTNPHGDIFGGWIVSQMDLAAGILAKRYAKGRAVTVAIDSMSFLQPVHVGDIVSCYVELIRVGKTSMTIQVQVWKEGMGALESVQVTQGLFTFVAIDINGRPRIIEKKVDTRC